MISDGAITISLNKAGVSIHSNRPIHASNIFEGKTVTETLQTLPLLFSVCGQAQSVAAQRACESIANIIPDPLQEITRERIVAQETIREHCWRILLGWAALVKQTPEQKSMALLLSTQQHYLKHINHSKPTDNGNYDNDSTTIKRILNKKIFGIPTEEWLSIADISQFEEWLKIKNITVATEMLNFIQQSGWNNLGSCRSQPLPTILSSERLTRLMENPLYIEQPLWDGEPCESTPLTRIHSPLVETLKENYGNGLIVRQVARLAELAQLVIGMDKTPSTVDSTPKNIGEIGSGIGRAQAARGELIHHVKIDEKEGKEIIKKYQILAPTEWNFHPEGVVAASLKTLNMKSPTIFEEATLIIGAIDPCVAYNLKYK
ncbi:MAG: hypothetical protein HOM84_01380 [Thiotrichales bacterium]|mgnify:CR=1 FL=1|jgi:coenzyme F420-reducing hydrogenase alpha subunit|nr:hypothetical protein [Thiotrichales bacterium]MBT3612731.1 hypothetical protein [Thiotrichales bacterium]MBT3752904.1 hypothetical protein [Thiotrichales bacterium]MBT3837996.1 hypothetical protein [Thiotrichales bacterium]MBT4152763.1 hypothetical protein [Thiotrichales bacterium]